jgi:hypothetical protein
VAWPRLGPGAENGSGELGSGNGYTELHTRNEERNEPMQRLNAGLGYRPGIGRIYLVGPIAGS